MNKASEHPIFHRLVVGSDGSEQGHDAAALGAMIAAASGGADVSLLGVYPTSLLPIKGMTDRETFRRLAERTLQSERRRWHMAAGIHTTSDFSIPRALTHHAERWKADLIVVGSGDRAVEGHAAISPRSRQLLGGGRFALAIARRGLAGGEPRLRTIGVGYDAGAESRLALDVAAGLARGAGAQLRILTVVDNRLPVLSFGQWMTLTDAELTSMWDSKLDQQTSDAREAVREAGVSATVDGMFGDPVRHLREFTGELDLLVIGSRRWGTLARVLAGSVGEALVGDSQCSLLMVPRPAGTRQARVRSASAVEQPVVQ